MRIRILAGALLLTAAACNWGTRPSEFPPAQGAGGAHVALRVHGETSDRLGELITVDSAGVVLRDDVDGHMMRTPWPMITALAIANASDDAELHPGESISVEKRARMALYSRFPQGIHNLPISIDSLILRARASTTRLADRRVAVAEGYRRVGADFPGMGEHWVNPNLLFTGRVDPAHPALLTYATIAGKPRLLGVGFMVVVHGDSVPTDLPGWPDQWHAHSGLLADESAAPGHVVQRRNDTHLWVMHAWTVLKNPDGDFVADNWALPYARAGLPVPAHIDPDASRTLALADDGGDFLRGALTDAGLRTDSNGATIDVEISTAHARAVAAVRDASTDVDALEHIWTQLAADLERTAGPGVRELMEATHTMHAGAHK
jgi:hypothetical protein